MKKKKDIKAEFYIVLVLFNKIPFSREQKFLQTITTTIYSWSMDFL